MLPILTKFSRAYTRNLLRDCVSAVFILGACHEIRQSRFLARWHLGFPCNSSLVLPVRSHRPHRSPAHHSPRLLLRLLRTRARLANCFLHHRHRSNSLSPHDDSFHSRKIYLRSRHPHSCPPTPHQSPRPALLLHRFFPGHSVRHRLFENTIDQTFPRSVGARYISCPTHKTARRLNTRHPERNEGSRSGFHYQNPTQDVQFPT